MTGVQTCALPISMWNPQHKCNSLKLFVMEGQEEFGNLSEGEEETKEHLGGETQIEGAEEELSISLHAISGACTPKMMRLKGKINHQECVVLIDSGSTHNFLDPRIMKEAQLKVDVSQRLAITVANGEKMRSEGQCKNVKLKFQGHEFVIEAHVLILGGCDVVLRVQWLSALGSILWNFNVLNMKFSHHDQQVLLKGLVSTHLVHDSLRFKGKNGNNVD